MGRNKSILVQSFGISIHGLYLWQSSISFSFILPIFGTCNSRSSIFSFGYLRFLKCSTELFIFNCYQVKIKTGLIFINLLVLFSSQDLLPSISCQKKQLMGKYTSARRGFGDQSIIFYIFVRFLTLVVLMAECRIKRIDIFWVLFDRKRLLFLNFFLFAFSLILLSLSLWFIQFLSYIFKNIWKGML